MSYYQKELLKQVSQEEAEFWIMENPVPYWWQGDEWSYAFWHMERPINE
nr:hypothetical protein [uncultured Carboxylicivirga sp.]